MSDIHHYEGDEPADDEFEELEEEDDAEEFEDGEDFDGDLDELEGD